MRLLSTVSQQYLRTTNTTVLHMPQVVCNCMQKICDFHTFLSVTLSLSLSYKHTNTFCVDICKAETNIFLNHTSQVVLSDLDKMIWECTLSLDVDGNREKRQSGS